MVSTIQEQHDIILDTIKSITRGDWKVLVIDESVKKIIDNVIKEDDILKENIANIERIEDRRDMNPDMDAIYLLSPQPHIVDCLMADLERHRYKKSFIIWTSQLKPDLHRLINTSRLAQGQIAGFETLSIDFFPRESQLITFRDPWSFPILYHPVCNNMVRDHLHNLAQKANPQILCLEPGLIPSSDHRYLCAAHVLCSHLANFVQEKLDAYTKWNKNFPPTCSRPTGTIIITDRSMDLNTPLLHEFTYQAMAHDLLPMKESDKIYYRTVLNKGAPDEQEKEMEINENDKIWVENRHRHMKDTIEKLMNDFQKFIDENPNFTNPGGDTTNLNSIKDMLAGLPQFQELKEAYSLHLSMAQECMNIFQSHKLADLASIEQSLATGLDEDFRRPKNIADELVRLLSDEQINLSDRRRLIMLYVIFRDGVILEDIKRLLCHAGLPPQNIDTVTNLDLLGAHTTKLLKESRTTPQCIFTRKTVPTSEDEDYLLSRYEPVLKLMLEEVVKNSLDQTLFPYTKPPLNNTEDISLQSQSSLRSAKPTWARNRISNSESRQRIIVFVAGGATYSESRACYEVSKTSGKDIILATSHMLSPELFTKQVSDLSLDRRTLNLPADKPKPKAPSYLFQRNDPPSETPRSSANTSRSPVTNGRVISNVVRPPGSNPNSAGNDGNSQLYKKYAQEPPTSSMEAISLNTGIPQSSKVYESEDANSLKGKSDKKSKHKDGEKKKRGFFGSKK
ncbi:Protein transport protein sec1 [Golovinomyces cichoracearum]|uniref:Protein transport protein sec1 n=1 Tax=Golovinomyces cichoracearum TaxID=62708 RepID=A0A420IHB2_9PEZI|nr:Protein transport protein sec1 [Golovinomyces cichoracearum]